MDDRLWLERLRVALARRRLPSAYAERLAQELADHFHDLTEEKMGTEALMERMGDPEQVAEAAETSYRRRGFFQRHRWLGVMTFLILPIPLLCVAWWVTLAAMALGCEVFGLLEWMRTLADVMTPRQDLTIRLILSAAVIVPATALTGLYFLLARRTGTRRRWAVAAAIVLAAVAGSTTSQLKLSSVPGQSQLLVGLSAGNYNRWQAAQLLLPVMVLAWCSRKMANDPSQTAA